MKSKLRYKGKRGGKGKPFIKALLEMIYIENFKNGFALKELLTEITIFTKRLWLIQLLGKKSINVMSILANMLVMAMI